MDIKCKLLFIPLCYITFCQTCCKRLFYILFYQACSLESIFDRIWKFQLNNELKFCFITYHHASLGSPSMHEMVLGQSIKWLNQKIKLKRFNLVFQFIWFGSINDTSWDWKIKMFIIYWRREKLATKFNLLLFISAGMQFCSVLIDFISISSFYILS